MQTFLYVVYCIVTKKLTMSHTVKIETVDIVSLQALKAAVAMLKAKGVKCHLEEKAVPRMYKEGQFQRENKREYADLVLRLEDSFYDVGFLLDKRPGKPDRYVPVLDPYVGRPSGYSTTGSSGIPAILGAGKSPIGKLLQAYSQQAVMFASMQTGVAYSSTSDMDGNIIITLNVK